MDPSTTTRARWSVDRRLCRWPWFTSTSTMARFSSSRGWRPTSGPVRTRGGRHEGLWEQCSLL
uniref:Uncharacterized protein n=1 Tax=Arundo donax TaxID=35708 RepID=A0A0A9EVV6_ARUDO